MKKLEAIIVCVNYGDILAHTLPHNRHHFDKLVVVTDIWDDRTRAICDFWNVTCISTNLFYDKGDIFNKANGINAGLKHLSMDSWVLHLDADIFLPPKFRTIFETLALKEDSIYGCDRWMINSYEEWMEFYSCPRKMHDGWVYTHQNTFQEKGCRVSAYQDEGYFPIGFFQLWHPIMSNVWLYPNLHGEADRTDMIFCKYWTKEQRNFIPEFNVVHLESENVKMGINWKGRKSKPFGPEIKEIQLVNFVHYKEKIEIDLNFGPFYKV